MRFSIIKLGSLSMVMWLAGISFLIIHHQLTTQKLGVIDTHILVGIEAQKIAKDYPKGNIPADKLQNIAEQLKKVINNLAQEHKLILIAKGALWGGEVPDYTEEVATYLQKKDE